MPGELGVIITLVYLWLKKSYATCIFAIAQQLSSSYSGWCPVNAWGDTLQPQSWVLPNETALRQYALALSHPVSGIPMQVCYCISCGY